jgi:L-ascorbate peroxidase
VAALQIQTALKGTPAEGVVSLADIIALAGAHAVALTGGPQMQVPAVAQ